MSHGYLKKPYIFCLHLSIIFAFLDTGNVRKVGSLFCKFFFMPEFSLTCLADQTGQVAYSSACCESVGGIVMCSEWRGCLHYCQALKPLGCPDTCHYPWEAEDKTTRR